ncbi:hypothetical protein Moror_1286 [Moniliophthora roreri MCA 2997]|uniref:Protein-S-isoprenylcysteine O-methyltransferase n=1 Tax=Moniliophthora roreri (strain MCA 2997) TaxID=1381753 RepID=V2WNQ0_MONRO|nr:hypothetical protein Moror_1286 [Moniliophthora roreri MCA 2997]
MPPTLRRFAFCWEDHRNSVNTNESLDVWRLHKMQHVAIELYLALTMEAALKTVLVVMTGISYLVAFTPPNGDPRVPPRPPLSKGLIVQREWFFVFVVARVLPLQRIMYTIATLNECLFILASQNSSVQTLLPWTYRTQPKTGITTLFLVGSVISIVGAILRVACYRALGAGFTFEMLVNNPKLITHGPYSVVRHPSYIGSWMCWIGPSIVQLVAGSWIRESGFYDNTLVGRVVILLWEAIMGFGMVNLILRVVPEDELMKKQFGKEWEEWAKKVPYKLIPGVY